MLLIGHRGALGSTSEKTAKPFHASTDINADILQFDVVMTRENELLVVHDSAYFKMPGSRANGWSTHKSIEEALAKGHKLAPLKDVLDMFFGKILLNLEVKGRDTGKQLAQFVEQNYIKNQSDWQNILFSSFKSTELKAIRKTSKYAELAMLHAHNPFTFMIYSRQLDFTAVGFHRLHINSFAIEVAKQLGLFTYSYTVNRPDAARKLSKRGIDAIITDDPQVIRAKLQDLL